MFDGVVSQERLVSENDERRACLRVPTSGCESVQPTSDRTGDARIGICVGDQLQSRRIEVPAQSSFARTHDRHSSSQESGRHCLSDGNPNVGNQRFPVEGGKELVAAEAEALSGRQNQGVGRTFAGRQVHATPLRTGPDPVLRPWRMCNRVKALTRRVAVLTIDGP